MRLFPHINFALHADFSLYVYVHAKAPACKSMIMFSWNSNAIQNCFLNSRKYIGWPKKNELVVQHLKVNASCEKDYFHRVPIIVMMISNLRQFKPYDFKKSDIHTVNFGKEICAKRTLKKIHIFTFSLFSWPRLPWIRIFMHLPLFTTKDV